LLLDMPAILRTMADQIERDNAENGPAARYCGPELG
jgi:hypothetical protein